MLLDQRDLDILRLIALCKDIPVDCSPLRCDMFSDAEFSAHIGMGYVRKSKSGLSYRLTDKGYALLSTNGVPAKRDKYPVGNGGTLRRRLDVAKTVLTMYRAGTDVFCVKLPSYLTAFAFRRESRGAMLGASKLCGVRYLKTQLIAVYLINEKTHLNKNVEMAAIENLSALLHIPGERMALFLADDMLMGLLPCLGNELFDISGKSPTEYLTYFLLGYFFLANDAMLQKLDTYRFLLFGASVLGAGFTIYFDNMLFEAVSWLSVLAILGMARHYFNFNGRITGYLSKSSFGIYLFHQSWIVITAFIVFKVTDNPAVQIPSIFVSSIILTYGTYEICKRVPVLRGMFGLKK